MTTKQAHKGIENKIQQEHSVYDLSSKEEAIKWMHSVCGYPVKYTWIKAIKSGNYVGRPMLPERNVARYYPDTNETPKGHLNQSRNNFRSIKPKRTPLEVPKTETLQGHKARDVYTSVYEVKNSVFSNQTEQSPTRSQQGNKYIMVMAEINSNAILAEPINNCKDEQLTRAYQTIMLSLLRAGINTKNHILDNEVSEVLKTTIKDE